MNGITPIDDRVFIKRDDSDKMTPGGLHIPDSAKRLSYIGEVVAVGPGLWKKPEHAMIPRVDGKDVARVGSMIDFKRQPMVLKEGDKVYYSPYHGLEVTIGTEKYLVMRESEVLAVVEES